MKKKQTVEMETPSTEEIFSAISTYLKGEVEGPCPPPYFLDTGSLALNYIISGLLDGGYCSSLVSELFGDPSTGKTLLMMIAVAKMQQQNGIVVVSDVERRWNWDFAKVHGVDIDKVLKDFPETVEEWSVRTDKILDEILEQDPIPKSLFILDSIASLSTTWEMENIGVKEDQGKKAKRIKAAMRVIPKKIAKAGAILIASNHLIADPRITYGSPLITPGGKGFFFQASVRIEMSKPIMITPEGKNRPIGSTLRVRCTKSSVCPPFGEAEMNVFWTKGMDRYSGLLDVMVDLDIVSQEGSWYEYNGKKFRARDVEQVCIENPEILKDERWTKPYFLS